MARFYWVFDGFVEPDRGQEYHGPEHGLRPVPMREELRARLEELRQSVKDEAAPVTPSTNPVPPAGVRRSR